MLLRFILLSCWLICQTDARNECGVAGTPSGLIINGTSSAKGAWPWVAAIYKAAGDQFICGGTLVAENMLLTVSVISDFVALSVNFLPITRQLIASTRRMKRSQVNQTT